MLIVRVAERVAGDVLALRVEHDGPGARTAYSGHACGRLLPGSEFVALNKGAGTKQRGKKKNCNRSSTACAARPAQPAGVEAH